MISHTIKENLDFEICDDDGVTSWEWTACGNSDSERCNNLQQALNNREATRGTGKTWLISWRGECGFYTATRK